MVKKSKIFELEKISSQITEERKYYNSLLVQRNMIQGNIGDLRKIEIQLRMSHRKILLLNQKYINEICKKCKVPVFKLTELIEGEIKNNAEI